MNKRIIATLLTLVMLVSCTFGMGMTAKADTCGGLEPEDVYEPSEEEVIKDPILHWAIRAAMNSIKGGVVLTADMVGDKSVRDISYELCAHPEDFEGDEWAGKQFWIENLEGIQYAKSAKLIDIGYTSAVEGKRIADVSPLAELTQLEQLILKQNGIDDISSLETLVNLTLFDVASNDIEDISAVRDMEKLKSLNASFNDLKEVDEISGLANLEYLSLSNNAIEELPDLSKLTKVYFLDLSHNKLKDVTALAGMKNLQELNLSANADITDITPLAGLLKLEKDKTALPDNSKKEDLFAAIEVNKLFNLFNISKMKESDLNNVQKALDAYEELTEEQKTYFDLKRIEAARSNMEKVKNGGEPDYYPEYDVEGEKQPVFNGLEISVVDKYGNPMADVEFSKISKNAYSESTTKVTTNSVGTFVLKHTALDALWDEITIAPSGDVYVANPEKITYTVAWGNVTDTVNGIPATGLEELKFTLIPKDEYVDKSDLEEALNNAEKVEEAYKYTKDSYQKFEAALNAAQKVLDDINATKQTVADTTAGLKTAIEGLEKTDILTELKLIVKDENGNTFTRPFKFQIKVPVTGAEAWNELSDPYTGTAYLKASPGWADGKEWEICACYEEPYDIDVFKVTIGVKDGVRYYKTVEGQPVDVDFEKVVTVKLRKDGAPDKQNERKPDSTVLEEYLEEARQYMAAGYTPASYNALQTAIKDAEAALVSSTVTQEDFNAAIAAIKQAEEGLTKTADKSELIKELDMQYSYSEENYTTDSWKKYQEKLEAADVISKDANATQDTVDEACAELVKARNELVRKVDKSELEAKLTEANALKEDDYQSGYEELQQAITAAQEVYNSESATQSQVEEQVKALVDAIEALVKKPAEVNYDCTQSMFRAKVVDKDGNPIAGVNFTAWIGGTPDLSFKSDANGVITYYTYGPVQYGYTTYVKLADDRYTTTDEHYFTVNNSSFVALIATIDGQPYADGTKLTYVLKEVGAEDPEPSDNILSDKTTFRAKVVDEDGNPLSGIEFNLIPPSWAYLPTKTVTTNANGILEYALDIENDWSLVYKVEIASEEYTLEPAEVTFQTGYPTELTYVNGIPLSEMTEAFVLTVKAADKPEPTDKVLSDAETFRAKVADKDGNPVSGIEFNLVVNGSTSGTITSNKDGVIEYKIGMYEGYKTYTVIPNNSNYTFEPGSMEFTLEGYPTKITVVNGTALSEATDELVFTVEGDLPTPPTDKVLSDAETFRAKVVDKDGNPISGISFDLVVSGSTSGTITSDKDGVIEYKIGMYEGYKTYKVTPNNSDYTFEPGSMEFTLEGYPTKITAVNGTALSEATEELVFTAKEDTPIPPATNKQELDDEIFFAKSFEGKAEDYTAESYKEFEDALAEAKKVYADENATQEQIDTAAENLKNARQGLKEVEKTPVCDKNTIRILIVDEADNKVTEEISFKVGTSTQKSRNGLIEYAISTADSGLQTITVTLNGESVLIGEKTYVIEPKQHEFTLEEYAGDIYISAIDGEELNGTKEVKFVLKEQGGQSVDKDVAIVVQPVDIEAKLGTTALFTVETEGEVVSYQWQYKNATSTKWYNSSMAGADTASLEVAVINSRDGQQYRCIVTGANGTQVISEVATINVKKNEVSIIAQPEDFEGQLGETAIFAIETEGEVVSYQWQYKNAASTKWYNSSMAGADTASLEVAVINSRDGQQYRCIVTGAEGTQVISEVATISVKKNEVSIIAQPKDFEGQLGETATFTVETEGEVVSYQWQYKNTTSSKWYNSSMAGADTATLEVEVINSRDGQQYRCVITDAEGLTVVSDAVAITVAK